MKFFSQDRLSQIWDTASGMEEVEQRMEQLPSVRVRAKNAQPLFYLTIFAMFSIILYACAAAPPEPEGGISGTGNAINCHDPANKHHKQCRTTTP